MTIFYAEGEKAIKFNEKQPGFSLVPGCPFLTHQFCNRFRFIPQNISLDVPESLPAQASLFQDQSCALKTLFRQQQRHGIQHDQDGKDRPNDEG